MQASEREGFGKAKQVWEPMSLGFVGHISEVVEFPGGGKTGAAADPGDPAKPPGQN
jgi:hypothetical protein